MPLVPKFSMTEKDKKRFHKKYVKTETCWNWTASCNKGYGAFRVNGKTEGAHKISLFLKTGQFYTGQDDLIACHSCKQNPGCVNPSHLDWKTNSENNGADRKRDGTEKPQNGERNCMAKLTEAQVLKIREKCATKKYTQRELAMEYGVNQATIGFIVRRQTWDHI